MKNRTLVLKLAGLVGAIVALLPVSAFAASGLTYHGRIIKPNNQPLEGASVFFDIQIRSPGAENCLLFQESQNLNMTGSNGIFVITIGEGVRAAAGVDGGNSLNELFANRGTLVLPSCAIGGSYSPNAADGRKLVVQFNDGSGWQTLSPQNINYVPLALESMQVAGYGKDQLLRVADGVTATEFSAANWTALWDLITGASTLYSKADGSNFNPAADVGFNNKKAINLADPSAAQDAATKNYVDTRLGGRTVDMTGVSNVAGDGKVLGWNQALQKWEGVLPADSSKLPLAGGIMSGAIQMNTFKITGMGDPLAAQDASTKAYSDANLRGSALATPVGQAGKSIRWNAGNTAWEYFTPQEALGFTPVNKVGDTMTGLLLLSGDPSSAVGAATKQYVDAVSTASSAAYVRIDGTTALTADWDLNGLTVGGTRKIVGLADPTVADGAATKGYVDTAITAVGAAANTYADGVAATAEADANTYTDAEIAALDASLQTYADGKANTAESNAKSYADGKLVTKALTVPIPGNDQQSIKWDNTAGTWVYYTPSSADATKLPLAGGIMSGAIAMGTYQITGMGDPILAQDAATKAYVDARETATKTYADGRILGQALAAPAAGQVGQSIRWKADGSGWEYFTASVSSGTVSSVTSANIDIGVATTTTTPVLTLNVGTGNNQIVKLNGSAELPAVSGVNLTALNATNIASGTLDDARLSANVALKSYADANLRGNALATPVGQAGKSIRWNVADTAWEYYTPSTGNALTTGKLDQFAATSSAELATVISDETGTGLLVYGTSPTLTTPTVKGFVLGGATSDGITMQVAATGATGTYTWPSAVPASSMVLQSSNTGALSWVAASTGSVTQVTSATTDIAITNTTTVPELTLNVGTGNNQIVKLNGSAQLPAVSGVNLTALNATNIASGTLDDARLSANVALKSYADANLRGQALATPVGQAGKSIRWNAGDTAWEYYTPTAGTVTSVATGTGLTGGAITGTGTISIAAGGVSATELASDAVTTAKILNKNVTYAKIQDVTATNRILGRATAGAGVIEEITLGTGLSFTGTTLNATGTGGTVTEVTSANTDIGIATTTTTPILTLNVGTGNNQIVKLNGSAQLPAVSGVNLTALNATNIASGTLDDARLSSNVALKSYADANLRGQALATPVGQAGKSIRWNAGNTAWEYYTPSTGTGDLMSNGSVALSADWDVDGLGAGTRKITGLAVPTDADGAVTKGYADSKLVSKTLAVPAGGQDGQSIRWNDTLGIWEYFTAGAGSGTVSSVTSANTDLTISNTTTTPQITVNSGTGASQLVKLTAAAKYPAVDGSLITLIDASNIASGALADARLSSKVVVAPTAPVVGNVLQAIRWNAGNTAWEYYTPAAGSVTSVATGTGLTGGTITGTGTISIAAGGVTAAELASDAVTTAKILDSNVTLAKIQNVAQNKILGRINAGTGVVEELGLGAGFAVTTGASPSVAVNTGTGNNQIVKLNGSAELPAVSGVNLTALNASNITSGTLADARLSTKVVVAPTAPLVGNVLQSIRWNAGNTAWEYFTAGTGNGDALTSGDLSQFAAGGTTSAELAAQLSDESGSASGGLVVFNNSPTIITPTVTTSATIPLIIGGTTTTSPLTYRTTTAAGVAGADHIFQVGNNGATEAMRIVNSGNVGIGTTNPTSKLQIDASASSISPLSIKTAGAAGNYTSTNSGIIVTDAAGTETLRIVATDPTSGNFNARNLYIGAQAGLAQPSDNTSAGSLNVGVGFRTLASNTTGWGNLATGYLSLQANTTGASNTAVGSYSLQVNTTGSNNTAVGKTALGDNSTGMRNTGIGEWSLRDITTGSDNVALGYRSGNGITTGSGNTIIGGSVTGLAAGLTNNIIIADGVGNRRINVDSSGNVGIGITAPTATLHLKAGTATANTAPLKLTSGVVLTAPEAGAIEFDGTNLYFTDSGATRRTIATGASGYSAGSTILAAAGTTGAPSLSFNGDPDTGMYSSNANTIGFTTGGTTRFNMSSGGLSSTIGGGALITTAAGTAAAPTFSFAGDVDTGWFSPTADTLAASTAGSERMRIDASGNVGIGTSSTTTQGRALHLYNSLNDGTAASNSTALVESVTRNSNLFLISADANAGAIYFRSQTDGTAASTSGAHIVYSQASKAMNFATNGSERVRIDASGNVGIGTASPNANYKLDVSGSGIRVNGSTLDSGFYANIHGSQKSFYSSPYVATSVVANSHSLVLDNPTVTTGSVTNYIGLLVRPNGGTYGTTSTRAAQLDLASGAGVHNIYASGTANNYFGGSVGIGNTSPAKLLELSAAADPTIRLSEASSTTSYAELTDAAASQFVIKKVTAAGISQIDISPMVTDGTSDAYVRIGRDTNTTGASGLRIHRGDGTAGVTSFLSGGSGNSYLNAAGGSVGIGTVTPLSLLHVSAATAGDANLTLESDTDSNGAGDNAFITLKQDGGSSVSYIGLGGAAGNAFNTTVTGSMANSLLLSSNDSGGGKVQLATNGAVRLSVIDSGNVGIGTNAPTEKLTVVGNVLATAYLTSSDERLKKNIAPLENSVEKLNSLSTVTFDWKKPDNSDADRKQIGLIAQDVQKVFPEAVVEDSGGWLRVNYSALISPVIDAVRELYAKLVGVDERVQALEKEVAHLKEENQKLNQLEERLKALESSRSPAGEK